MKKLAFLLVLLPLLAVACGTSQPVATSSPTGFVTVLSTETSTSLAVTLAPTSTATQITHEGILTLQVHVRSGPGTGYDSLGLLNAGQTVLVISKDAQSTWYQILYSSAPQGRAWVIAQYVQLAAGVVVPVDSTPTPAGPTGRVTLRINVRSGPGMTFNSLGTLEAGATVALTGRNSTASWYQIDYSAGPDGHGWVTVQYVQTDATADLPVLDDFSKVVTPGAPGTPSGPEMTPTPTIGPALADGDSETASESVGDDDSPVTGGDFHVRHAHGDRCRRSLDGWRSHVISGTQRASRT